MQLLHAASADSDKAWQTRACTTSPPNALEERTVMFVKKTEHGVRECESIARHGMDEPIDDEFIEEPSDKQPMSGAVPYQVGP